MSWIAYARGTCDCCGPFRLPATNVTVRQRIEDGSWAYRVHCPTCRSVIVARVTSRVAFQLLLAQASFESWSLPVATREHGEGPAVSLLDLEQLHADLLRVDAVDALRAELDAVER